MSTQQTSPPTPVINAIPEPAPPPTTPTAQPAPQPPKSGEDGTTESLKDMQENAGQISELAKEEENLVTEFFSFLFKILKPFGKTVEISPSSLPESYKGRVNKSYLYLTGQLVLVYTNGDVEILNLGDQENHDLLVEITSEIMTKLKTVINLSKSKTEKRVRFLVSITKELQKVAKVFSEE